MVTKREGHVILLGAKVQARSLCCRTTRKMSQEQVYCHPPLFFVLVTCWPSVPAPHHVEPGEGGGGSGLSSVVNAPVTLCASSTKTCPISVLGLRPTLPSWVICLENALPKSAVSCLTASHSLIPLRQLLACKSCAAACLSLGLCYLQSIENQRR